jgi:hypothetical protein
VNTVMIAYYLGTKKENDNATFFDRLVCFATRSRYSHLEYVNYYNPDNGKAWCWSSSPRDGGVRQALITLDSGSWELYEVQTEATRDEIEDWMRAHKGAKYDWVGAFATKVPLLWHMFSRWFCSEALAAAFKLFKPASWTPESFFRHFLPDSVKIYLNIRGFQENFSSFSEFGPGLTESDIV